MKMKTALITLALLLAGGVSFAAVQQGQRRSEDGQKHAGRGERDSAERHGRLSRLRHHRQHGRDFLRSLNVSESQKRQAREVARSLQPIVDDVRPRVRPLIEQARELARSGNRESARELVRSQLRPLLRDAAERARPLVQPLVETLSPDQRAKLEAAASARGRSFDEERFTRRLTWRLGLRGARRGV